MEEIQDLIEKIGLGNYLIYSVILLPGASLLCCDDVVCIGLAPLYFWATWMTIGKPFFRKMEKKYGKDWIKE